jgi:hypothetical protein
VIKRTIASTVVKAVLIAVLLPVLAVGSGHAASSPAPAVGTMEVQLWLEPTPGQAIVIISLRLPEDVELPTVARIPIPDGVAVDWVGELSDAGPEEDIERSFEITQGAGARVVEFEMSEFRHAQVEVSGVRYEASGRSVSAGFDFVQSAAASSTGFSVRLPAGAGSVKLEPEPKGEPSRNSNGETLHVLAPATLVSGDSVRVSAEYRPGSMADSGGQADTIIGILLAVLALCVLALAVILARQKARRALEDEL